MAKIKPTINMDTETVTWQAPFNQLRPLSISIRMVSSHRRLRRAMLAGLSHTVTDAGALPAAKFGGKVPLKAKWDAMAERIKFLAGPGDDWSAKRASVERVETGPVAFLGQALLELKPKWSAADLERFLSDKTAAQRAALCEKPKIKPVVERLMAESVADVDVSDMMAELGLDDDEEEEELDSAE